MIRSEGAYRPARALVDWLVPLGAGGSTHVDLGCCTKKLAREAVLEIVASRWVHGAGTWQQMAQDLNERWAAPKVSIIG